MSRWSVSVFERMYIYLLIFRLLRCCLTTTSINLCCLICVGVVHAALCCMLLTGSTCLSFVYVKSASTKCVFSRMYRGAGQSRSVSLLISDFGLFAAMYVFNVRISSGGNQLHTPSRTCS
ncbi:hypothetical protein CSKR_202932 [Clonorchis sinensis]|uniref:Uncharacterized protein n=1 Tax=Clonorchis sinensis TaxID=79923 RepID=A0A8T1M405_CLOSI|nr:hypothetical protein CSKR_202932 [Clonorchis sinensis]